VPLRWPSRSSSRSERRSTPMRMPPLFREVRESSTRLMTAGCRVTAKGLGVVVFIVALVVGFAPIAAAHTDFEGSDPADGAVVSEPVSEIRVRFTAESLIAGDGFVVLTPSGEIISPEVRVSEDQREFTLVFDPPLASGDVGVQWSVRAGDAHPIEGTFSFTTTAPGPAPEVHAPETGQQPEPQAESDEDSQTEDLAVVPEAAAVNPPDLDESAPENAEGSPEELVEPAPAAVETTAESPSGQDVGAATVTLDDFLSSSDEGTSLAEPVGFVGRFASQAGSLVAIGVVAFALWVSSQPMAETRIFVHCLRQCGVLVVTGAIVELVGLVMSLGSFTDVMFSSAGLAILLRAVGAVGLIALTTRIALTQSAPSSIAADERVLAGAGGSFSGAVAVPENAPPPGSVSADEQMSARIGPKAWGSAGLLALSYVFDGHTVTKGNRLLTAVIDLVHVFGAAVWLGGLVCLVLLSRTRNSDANAFIAAVVKFSVVAAIALGAVGVAGLGLTVTILDSFSELWSTAWGRLLIAKVMIVAVAATAGAFNHFVLIPKLRSQSALDEARHSLVRTIKVEVAALGVAVAVTSVLVAAAS